MAVHGAVGLGDAAHGSVRLGDAGPGEAKARSGMSRYGNTRPGMAWLIHPRSNPGKDFAVRRALAGQSQAGQWCGGADPGSAGLGLHILAT